ncbi:hypothetical protein Ae201684P_021994 [Aphanomyces euteiches]|uniref:Uncharacterized protein n=1 Tax=Aphanomyces euteiches TaxID=100861 RepID=A0A6G0W7B9_9STRA|nr:hypothetical protein Ae201684_018070 [Aphanomyces euteiches]KAH9072415.1 hypothetical protein Ae201684P_021994 [Aphanomyces euteiches]
MTTRVASLLTKKWITGSAIPNFAIASGVAVGAGSAARQVAVWEDEASTTNSTASAFNTIHGPKHHDLEQFEAFMMMMMR